MSEDRTLYDTAALGVEVASFLRTPIGEYIQERATRERHQALEALATAHYTDAARIQRLQNDARIPELLLQWLADAINQGDIALAQLHELEVNEHD